ncbi:putative ABC transporter related protein [Candidatus Terasakiella magnetica]|uniref:Putative ABC transporter related protein n=1 Tax=Candidatus Terasakiella magnetica TaxID=1867952 RepID=A0A1C3RG78_9PROT|nr:ABC transporter ATP-binding protein [Candidatus Terasakiella magnetica]SCA56290.1 putative ABC transporter related protein [Candidatus Terasakiella magnetica]
MLTIFKELLTLENKQRKWGYAGLFVLTVINSFLEAIGIALVLPLIGVVADSSVIHDYKLLQWVFNFLGFSEEKHFIYFVCLSFAGVIIFKNLYMVSFHYIQLKFIAAGAERISRNIYEYYLYLPFNQFIKRNSSEMVNNITRQARGVYSLVASAIINLSADSMVALMVVVVLTVAQPVIVLVSAFILVPLFFLQYKLYSKKLGDAGNHSLQASDDLLFCLQESFKSIKETKISGSENYLVKHFLGIQERVSKYWIVSQVLNRLPYLIAESVMVTCVVSALFYLLTTNETSSSIFATLGLMGAAFMRLVPMLNRILVGVNTLHEFRSSMGNIHKDLSVPLNQAPQNVAQITDAMPFSEKVSFQDVTFTFADSNESILQDLNFEIKKGELIGVAGETGSGKTTLINILCGLLTPSQGEILIDDKAISDQIRAWQLNLAYVPQAVFISDDSVRRNVAFGVEDQDIDDQNVIEALEKVALGPVLKDMPEGLNTSLGEHGSRLSGGQAQRLGIARALYQNRNMLILDEATSALDNTTEREISGAINNLKGDKTIVVIAHRLNTLKDCDKIIFLKKGKIDTVGTYEELSKARPDFFKKTEENSVN